MSADIDDIALTLPCPACGAQPTYWCVTYRPTSRPAGLVTTWLHTQRTHAVREAWSLGYREGNESGLKDAAWHLRAARNGMWWAQRANVPVPTDDTVPAWLEKFAERWSR